MNDKSATLSDIQNQILKTQNFAGTLNLAHFTQKTQDSNFINAAISAV